MTKHTTQEHPILFKGEMVRAILDTRKTQTRRIIKPSPNPAAGLNPDYADCSAFYNHKGEAVGYGFVDDEGREFKCPYGKPGDRLWVRETWAAIPADRPSGYWSNPKLIGKDYWYKATDHLPDWGGKWKPSIHMPCRASRINLLVTDVRVERVQEISETDAIAEGIDVWHDMYRCGPDSAPCWTRDAVVAFGWLWDSINAARGYSWESNPWVWVVEFQLDTSGGIL